MRDMEDVMENRIEMFFHCAQCMRERPEHLSPREWASLEVGRTPEGIQVWCKRHEVNVAHLRDAEDEAPVLSVPMQYLLDAVGDIITQLDAEGITDPIDGSPTVRGIVENLRACVERVASEGDTRREDERCLDCHAVIGFYDERLPEGERIVITDPCACPGTQEAVRNGIEDDALLYPNGIPEWLARLRRKA